MVDTKRPLFDLISGAGVMVIRNPSVLFGLVTVACLKCVIVNNKQTAYNQVRRIYRGSYVLNISQS